MSSEEGEVVWDVEYSEGRQGLAGWRIKYGVYKINNFFKKSWDADGQR